MDTSGLKLGLPISTSCSHPAQPLTGRALLGSWVLSQFLHLQSGLAMRFMSQDCCKATIECPGRGAREVSTPSRTEPLGASSLASQERGLQALCTLQGTVWVLEGLPSGLPPLSLGLVQGSLSRGSSLAGPGLGSRSAPCFLAMSLPLPLSPWGACPPFCFAISFVLLSSSLPFPSPSTPHRRTLPGSSHGI